MSLDEVTLLVAVAAALFVLWRSTVGFALFAITQMTLREIGLVILARNGDAAALTAWLFLAGIAAFLVGYVVFEYFWRHKPPRTKRQFHALPDGAVKAVVFAAGLLALYHLAATGLPILSSDIERERFDFTSSGLFGIPGRMYLFGVNIAWIAASVNAQARGVRWRSYNPWRWATFFLIVPAVLGGFKGDVISLVITFIAVYVVVSDHRLTLGEVVRKYWWTAVLGIGYFAAVAALYPTYNSRGDGFVAQLRDRLTIGPSEPIYVAMEGYSQTNSAYPVLSDFGYFIRKYSGGDVIGDYAFERGVSATIIGVDPASSAFTTPVTVSGYAELYASFGLLIAMIGVFAAGAVLAYGEAAPKNSALGVVLRAVAGLMIVSWLAKGGLAYHLLNFGAVASILAVVGLTAHFMSKPQPARPPANARARNLTGRSLP